MVSQDNIDNQHASKEYRLIVGLCSFVGLLIIRYALAKVAWRLNWMRDHFRGRMQTVVTILIVLALIVFAILVVINIAGKHKQFQKHTQATTPPDEPKAV